MMLKELSARFSNAAERFRNCKTRRQFDNACEHAGQLVWQAIDSGLLELPIPAWPKPQRNPADPTQLGTHYAMGWSMFVECWARQCPDDVPPNPHAMTYQNSPGLYVGTSGDWEAIAHNYAAVCDWLVQAQNNQEAQNSEIFVGSKEIKTHVANFVKREDLAGKRGLTKRIDKELKQIGYEGPETAKQIWAQIRADKSHSKKRKAQN